MELIHGVSFFDHVRPGAAYPNDAPTIDSEDYQTAVSGVLGSGGTVNTTRLRSALMQLTEGVGALHRAGKLHRDLKPQNVLVTENGRVVVLDFGLLADIDEKGEQEAATEIVGTPAYLAPEAAAGLVHGAESDWYSVGVMLYEVLTGRLPFDGKPVSMLIRKQMADPVDPEPLLEPNQRHFARLSMQLLARRPQDRPKLESIQAALVAASDHDEDSEISSFRGEDVASLITYQPSEYLVGREASLELMSKAFENVVQGKGTMLRGYGRSGMGKTSLVRFFVDDLRRAKRARVLSGRCFECESVPYKALDSLIDALTQWLLARSCDEVVTYLPKDILPLARMFPVLRRIPVIAAMGDGEELEGLDYHEVRKSAFSALRSLFGEVSRRKPVVLWIDDLQWGDEDSAAFFSNLLQPPDAPRVLLILSHRSEDTETSPILRQIVHAQTRAAYRCFEVEVSPLSQDACERLASLILREQGSHDSALPFALASESGGCPLFVLHLVRHALRLDGGSSPPTGVRLDDVLWEYLGTLSAPAARMLRVVALAGRSIELSVAREVAGLSGELREALDVLRTQRLIRTQGVRSTDLVEPYHDRIREIVTSRMSLEERVSLHQALARCLESRGADPETLVVHYRGSGDRESAWRCAVAAAERAAEALAFRRAADLYREALLLKPERRTYELRIKLADALANAGHGADASAAYLEALVTAPAQDVLEIRRKAAEQALLVGKVDEGLALIDDMLAAAGMKLTKTSLGALLSLLWRRAWLRVRGVGFRGTYHHDPEILRRIDVGWALAVGLSNCDTIRGADLQVRALLLALSAGEPSRIARGLALQAGMLAVAGPKCHDKCMELLDASRALTSKLGDPFTLGWYHVGAAAVAYFEGRFGDCISEGDKAMAAFTHCSGVSWERTTIRHYAIWSLMWIGHVGAAAKRTKAQLEAAFERGDLYSATDLRLFTSNMAWLVDDTPQEARRAVDEAMEHWSRRGFHAQHYYALYAYGQIDLYIGDGESALKRVDQAWSPLRASMLLQVQTVRIEMLHLRARSALAAVHQCPERATKLLRRAKSDAAELAREYSIVAPPMAELIRAAIASIENQSERCVACLRKAIEGFEAAEMGQYANVARRWLAIRSHDEAALAATTAYMESEGIQNIERWTQMLAPGFANPQDRPH
jgi:tetratricopeptide (TPR) repeat protein